MVGFKLIQEPNSHVKCLYLNFWLICNSMLGIGEAKMDWPTRLKVALGAAKGLAYLHSSSSVGISIVHRDFKSTNVLLNANFEAKVKFERILS